MQQPRNFDADRQQRRADPPRFILAGREFTAATSVKPDTIMRFAAVAESFQGPEALTEMDEIVRTLLSPASRPVWDEVRALDGDDTVTLEDIVNVMQWLVEATTGRPTLPSPPSSTPPPETTTGTLSTAASSPPGIPLVYPASTPAS